MILFSIAFAKFACKIIKRLMVLPGQRSVLPMVFLSRWILLVLMILQGLPAYSGDSFRLRYYPQRLDEFKDFSFLPDGLTPEMLSSVPSDERVKNHLVTILPFRENIYAFRDCFFDVFLWTGESWENQYPGTVHGYNCFSWKFIYHGDIYSLGRYGFYKMHSEIIRWSLRDKRWNMVPVKDLPQNYSSSVLGLQGDSLISLFGNYLNESVSLFKPEFHGYMLDLKEQRWLPLLIQSKILKKGSGENSLNIDLDDFLVFKHGKESISGFFILDKKGFIIYFWDRPNTLGSSPFFLDFGNKFIYQEMTAGIVYVDFDEGRDEFVPVGKLKVKRNNYGAGGYGLLALGLLFLISIVVYYRVWKKARQKVVPSNGMGEPDVDLIERYMAMLMKYSGQSLQVEELDRVLEIDHLPNPDYKRVRRSRLVSEINARHHALNQNELIKRRRNNYDKRLVEYVIL